MLDRRYRPKAPFVDVLSPIYDYLTELVIKPVTEQFFGIFDRNGRLGVLFRLASYSIA